MLMIKLFIFIKDNDMIFDYSLSSIYPHISFFYFIYIYIYIYINILHDAYYSIVCGIINQFDSNTPKIIFDSKNIN